MKDALVSALYVAKEVLVANRKVLDDITDELSEKEKVMGAELHGWLDDVKTSPILERFLRGENVLPPTDSPLWHMLPLPQAKETKNPAAVLQKRRTRGAQAVQMIRKWGWSEGETCH